MAAYTITAAEVSAANQAAAKQGIGDAALGVGQVIYKKSSNGRWALAQADGTAEEAQAAAIVIAGCAAAGQPILYVDTGSIVLDTGALANATLGDIVVLGATAGGLYPSADLLSGDFVTIVGYITDDNPGTMTIHFVVTGVELA